VFQLRTICFQSVRTLPRENSGLPSTNVSELKTRKPSENRRSAAAVYDSHSPKYGLGLPSPKSSLSEIRPTTLKGTQFTQTAVTKSCSQLRQRKFRPSSLMTPASLILELQICKRNWSVAHPHRGKLSATSPTFAPSWPKHKDSEYDRRLTTVKTTLPYTSCIRNELRSSRLHLQPDSR
jgi:hypothetical protein